MWRKKMKKDNLKVPSSSIKQRTCADSEPTDQILIEVKEEQQNDNSVNDDYGEEQMDAPNTLAPLYIRNGNDKIPDNVCSVWSPNCQESTSSHRICEVNIKSNFITIDPQKLLNLEDVTNATLKNPDNDDAYITVDFPIVKEENPLDVEDDSDPDIVFKGNFKEEPETIHDAESSMDIDIHMKEHIPPQVQNTQSSGLCIKEGRIENPQYSIEKYAEPISPSSIRSDNQQRLLRKQKLQNKVKVLKLIPKTKWEQTALFVQLCNILLKKEFANFVKLQAKLSKISYGKRYDNEFKLFCLNLYYVSPQAYKLLQKTLSLPSLRTLHRVFIPVTTKINDNLLDTLKCKVKHMTARQKTCSIVVGITDIRVNLFYNITQDKIIGFHEIDGYQRAQPANHAIIVMISSIFDDWSQPIGYAFLAECRSYDNLTSWIDMLIKKLINIGINIRALVSGLDGIVHQTVTPSEPFFTVAERKIFYFYDIPDIITSIRDDLKQYDFHFEGNTARWKDLMSYYEKDSNKPLPLSPQLRFDHFNPSRGQKKKIELACDLLSHNVAAGMAAYVRYKEINADAWDTVELLKKICDIIDILDYDRLSTKSKQFSGTDEELKLLKDMLTYLDTLKLTKKYGCDGTGEIKFINALKVTINSIIGLHTELTKEGQPFLLTGYLNGDAIKNFLAEVSKRNSDSVEVTCMQLALTFKKMFITSILKTPVEGRDSGSDVGSILVQALEFKNLNDDEDEEVDGAGGGSQPSAFSSVSVTKMDYLSLHLPKNHGLLYFCEYLLNRCFERHSRCVAMQKYVKPPLDDLQSKLSRYQHYYLRKKLDANNIPAPDDFVEFIKKLDVRFEEYFNLEFFNCTAVAEGLLSLVDSLTFGMPCPCFPILYLKKLFIRARLFCTLKSNNASFKRNRVSRTRFEIKEL